MKKFFGVLLTVMIYLLNSIVLCGMLIIGIDLIRRSKEDNRED